MLEMSMMITSKYGLASQCEKVLTDFTLQSDISSWIIKLHTINERCQITQTEQ